MTQNEERKEERLDKILYKTNLLISKSDGLREDINQFSRTTFGFQSRDDIKVSIIEPKCVANDILTNLAIINNILDFVNDTISRLNEELEDRLAVDLLSK